MYYFEVPCASDEDQLEATPVKCISSDNIEIFVEIGILRVSKMLNDLLGDKPNPEEVEIPLAEVKADTFHKVIEWCKNHKGAPDPIIKHDPVTRQREWITMTEWEEEFFRRYLPHLWDLAMAANYLNISSLYYCTCQKIAEQIKGKSPEQIREMFGIEDDLTDKEKRQIRRRNMRNMLSGYR